MVGDPNPAELAMANANSPCPQLAAAVVAHEESLERVEALLARVTPEQALWKPDAKAWSIAECIEHLNLTIVGYLDPAEAAFAKARAAGKTGSAPYGRGTFIGRFLVRFLGKGADKKKVGAPGVFVPARSDLDVAAVAERFRANTARFIAIAKGADGLALGGIRIPTPISRLLRVSGAQMFAIHTLHTPRHVEQAERVSARLANKQDIADE